MADARAGLILDAVDRTAQAFNSVDRRVRALNQVATFATRTLAGVGAAIGVRELTQAADTYRILSNRLKLVTDSADELADVQSRLFDVSQETRGSYEATVELYARIARSSDELGLSQSRLITLTQAINQAVQVSGATAQEASAGLIQFAQGLASGTLRGDELRSVLEQMPRLAQAIAAGMGVTVGQLRELGSEGKLTAAEVIGAIESQTAVLQSEFAKTEATVGQSITGLGNSLLRLVGKMDEASGASSLLARALGAVSAEIDYLARDRDSLAGLEAELERVKKGLEDVAAFGPAATKGREARIAELEALIHAERLRASAMEYTARLEQEASARAEAAKPRLETITVDVQPKDNLRSFDSAFGDSQERMQQQREQAAAALEEVRQHMLTREEVEREAITRRLEVVRTAHEQGLIDQTRFYELSVEVARRGNEEITRITQAEASKREKFMALSTKAQAQHVLGALVDMTAGVAQHNKTMFQVNKVAAIANAIINTHQAATQALAAYPPPISFAMAAAQIAAGLAQVQAIRSASFQGGGGGTTPSSAGSVPSVNGQPFQQAPTLPERSEARAAPRIEVIVQGSVIGSTPDQLASDMTRLLREHIDLTDDRL